MRQHSSNLVDVLSGSFERELMVNVFNGTDRPLQAPGSSRGSLTPRSTGRLHRRGQASSFTVRSTVSRCPPWERTGFSPRSVPAWSRC